MLASYAFNLRPHLVSPFDAGLPNLRLLEGEQILPEHYAPVVLQEYGEIRLRYLRWGLIPEWAKDSAMGRNRLTAAAHNIFQRPSFHSAIRHKRCLIPAESFELHPGMLREDGGYQLSLKDNSKFFFAGIYDCWEDPSGELVHSFAIIHTEAPAALRAFSRQVPLVLPRHLEKAWLNPETNLTRISQMIQRLPDDLLKIEALPAETSVAPLVSRPAAA